MDVEVVSPFPEYAWPLVWQWIQTFRARVCDDFAPLTCAGFVSQMTALKARTWAVYRDEELGGVIVIEGDSPHRATAHCIFSRAFWGRETTLPAMRAVGEQVFAGSLGKVMMFPFSDNHQMRALNRELGAVEEGILKGHTLRGGKPVDQVAMALFKDAFYVAAHKQDHIHLDQGHPVVDVGPQ